MPETPTNGPINDPYEAVEQAQEGEIARPEQPPMDDAASGLPEDEDDEMTDNS
jgi:hypothetical protein